MVKKEPQIFFTRRAQRLARLLCDPTYDISEDILGKRLELTFRQPLYVEDNGNSRVLRRERGKLTQTEISLMGYVGEVFVRPLYGSATDYLVLHGERQSDDLPVEKDKPKKKNDSEVSGLVDRIIDGVRSSGVPKKELSPEDEMRLEERLDRVFETIEEGEAEVRESMFVTDERYKGSTIIPFSEIKDYSVVD